MRTIILAGGKGTRLEPFTTVLPKPLIPIGRRPILDIIVRQLSFYGFKEITFSVGYLAELIQSYFQNVKKQFPDVTFTYIREEKPTGTAGSLSAIPDLKDTFLVMNGDILTTLDFSKMVIYHKEKGGLLTIAMHRKRIKMDLGVIEADSKGNVLDYIEKPEKIYQVSMGIYIYEPAVLQYIPPDEYLDFPDLVSRLLQNGERIVTYPCDEYWLDIGNHDDFMKAQQEFEEMKDKFLPHEGVNVLQYVEDTII